jgi:hypothetical protein
MIASHQVGAGRRRRKYDHDQVHALKAAGKKVEEIGELGMSDKPFR